MIPARRVGWFNAWFCGHARSRIRSTFGEVRVRGLEGARGLSREAPLLVISNHTSWWDPLVAMHVSLHMLEKRGHAMMDARSRKRLPFFGMVGGFGVELGNKADGIAAIRYSAELLNDPKNLVWIFPQGTERPVTERPLGFRNGSAEISRMAKSAKVLPIGLRYEFGGMERPGLWISFGEAVATSDDSMQSRAAQEAAVTGELDRIDAAIRGKGADEFDTYWRTAPSVVGMGMERMLAMMTRPWAGG